MDDTASPKVRLATAAASPDRTVVARIARTVLQEQSELGAEATEFLTRLAFQDVGANDHGFDVVLERDALNAADVSKYLQDLWPFWRALFASGQPNPRIERQERSRAGVMGRAADAFHGLAADNVLVLLEDDRLDYQVSWHVNPDGSGQIVIDTYRF